MGHPPTFRSRVTWVQAWAVAPFACLIFSACLSSTPPRSTANATTSQTTPPTISIPGGEKAAKIIFKVIDGSIGAVGSFDSFPNSGTVPGEGTGFGAVRAYRPDNTVLSTFPSWLTGVEVGISGPGNTNAVDDDKCATFAQPAETTALSCLFKTHPIAPLLPAAADRNCGAPGSYYRVSEANCTSSTTAPGDGRATDPIYIRAFFSRNTAFLGASENIMAVIEYSATSFTKFQTDPQHCWDPAGGGGFSAEKCSDFVWRAFLRASTDPANPPTTPPASFMLFVPPTNSYVDPALTKTGGEIVTKQMILPLASDPTLKVFQLSRIKSRLNITDMGAARFATFDGTTPASAGTCDNNSPFCAGLVIYSITFYRI